MCAHVREVPQSSGQLTLDRGWRGYRDDADRTAYRLAQLVRRFLRRRYLARHGLNRDGLHFSTVFTSATDRPARVDKVRLTIRVPGGLPPGREAALLAVASHCTVHNTLRQPPDVAIELA